MTGIKNNILHQSKNYKNHFENSNFWGMWPLGHVGHVTYSFINMLFISTGIFYKLRPQILSVGTTANSPLRIFSFKNFIHQLFWNPLHAHTYFYVCPKAGPEFLTPDAMHLFVFNGLRWLLLLVLLIFVELSFHCFCL